LDGLAKYDGASWTVYNTANTALPDNHIKALAADTAGNLWIGTVQGLVKFDGTAFAVFDLSNAPFELSDNINHIHIDSNNVFTIGTLNGGLVKIEDTVWTVYTIPNGSGIPDNTQWETAVDTNGAEWMATPANGLVAHPGPGVWLAYNPFTSAMPAFGATSLELLYNPGRIWVGTYDKGVVRKTGAVFEHFDPTNSPFPDAHVQFVERDASGMLWMGTPMSGLVRLDESLLSGLDGAAPGDLLIYPQPVASTVNIGSGMPLAGMELFRLDGSRAFEKRFPAGMHSCSIDLQKLAAGIYVLRLHTAAGRVIVSRLVKVS
jgi:hypothetical protein